MRIDSKTSSLTSGKKTVNAEPDAVEETHFVSKSPALQKIFKQVSTVAPTNATVLLNGETGVGKSMLAKLLHDQSPRHNKPFIAVNCGAIPETLIESELFGYEKGAFTGADHRKLGRFELANHGTIFLDEISCMPFHLQMKLLHILQDKTMIRVGGEVPIQLDVRVIAATNDNLTDLSNQNQFRKDLYYRLNVFPLDIPPLRKRKEDIPLLAEHFLNQFNESHKKELTGITDEAKSQLTAYHWPGNIRELRNILERACIIEETTQITGKSLPADLYEKPTLLKPTSSLIDVTIPLGKARKEMVDRFEFQYLTQLLTENFGIIRRCAEQAGITTRQLQKLMVKHGIKKELFR
ncbi:sigma-54 dependent transcriptional regulator [bacterium]|nr:sigma-54 dependent transcriptional regulator [bacterium]